MLNGWHATSLQWKRVRISLRPVGSRADPPSNRPALRIRMRTAFDAREAGAVGSDARRRPRPGRRLGAAPLFLGVFMFFFGLDRRPGCSMRRRSAANSRPGCSMRRRQPVVPRANDSGCAGLCAGRTTGAMLGGIALALGFWTRIAAAVSLVVVLSLQLAAGSMFRYELPDGRERAAAGGRPARR